MQIEQLACSKIVFFRSSKDLKCILSGIQYTIQDISETAIFNIFLNQKHLKIRSDTFIQKLFNQTFTFLPRNFSGS